MYFSEINSEQEVMAVVAVVVVVVVTCLFVYFKGWRRREEKKIEQQHLVRTRWIFLSGARFYKSDRIVKTDPSKCKP